MRAAIEPIELHNYGFSPSFIRGYRGARDQDSIRQMQAPIPTVRRKTQPMTGSRPIRWLLSSFSFPILVATLYAQTPNGTIVARVTDSTGAVVPNVQVTVRNEATGLTRETLSNDAGEYRIPLLPVGNYSVKVELSGFKTHIKKGIKLEIMQTARVDVGLELGNIHDVVSVDAKVPQLESESSASGQVIKNEQVTNLPLNVRQFMQMVFLTPFSVPATRGIRSTLEPRDTTAPTAGGQRPESNNYQIDGFDDREGGLNNVSVSPSVDSIG